MYLDGVWLLTGHLCGIFRDDAQRHSLRDPAAISRVYRALGCSQGLEWCVELGSNAGYGQSVQTESEIAVGLLVATEAVGLRGSISDQDPGDLQSPVGAWHSDRSCGKPCYSDG